MIIEFDCKQDLFVARSRGPKKRSGGGPQSPELDKNIYPMKLIYRFVSALQDAGGYAISRQNNLELHLSCHTC